MTIRLIDAALLSQDVYDQSPSSGSGITAAGWSRVDGMCWPSGFAAGTYERDGLRVVVYRGTDDLVDVWENVEMAPKSVRDVLDKVGTLGWILPGPMQIVALGSALLAKKARASLPREQHRQALAYFGGVRGKVVGCFGHSLGGALAMAVASSQGVAAIAFNAPMVGGLDGIAPRTNLGVVQVCASGDAISGLTARLGSLPSGRVIEVEVSPYKTKHFKPSAPARRSLVSGLTISGLPSALTDSSEAIRHYWAELHNALKHYHSIDTLVDALRGGGVELPNGFWKDLG